MTDHNVPHEYGPSRVGHGEAQCKWCHGTNRENAIIAPNHCAERAVKALANRTATPDIDGLVVTDSDMAGIATFDPATATDRQWTELYCDAVNNRALIMSLSATIAEKDKRIEALEGALRECADDLEAELRGRWCIVQGNPHPAMKPKFDRDMQPVYRARTTLGDTER
jgi:hypothetical protein